MVTRRRWQKRRASTIPLDANKTTVLCMQFSVGRCFCHLKYSTECATYTDAHTIQPIPYHLLLFLSWLCLSVPTAFLHPPPLRFRLSNQRRATPPTLAEKCDIMDYIVEYKIYTKKEVGRDETICLSERTNAYDVPLQTYRFVSVFGLSVRLQNKMCNKVFYAWRKHNAHGFRIFELNNLCLDQIAISAMKHTQHTHTHPDRSLVRWH